MMLNSNIFVFPPYEYKDKSHIRAVNMLEAMMLVMTVISGMLAVVITLINQNADGLVIILLIAVGLVGSMILLMRIGRVFIARNLLIAIMWIAPTIAAFYIENINLVIYSTYFTVVLIAGLCIDLRSATVYAVFSSLILLIIDYVKSFANITPLSIENSAFFSGFGFVANLIMIIAIIRITNVHIDSVVDMSTKDEKSLLINNQQLRATKIKLIEQAIELTNTNKELKQEIATRRNIEDEKNKSIAEKDVLLKEIHHRVKNNLQIVSSMLYLQSKKTDNIESKQVFLDSQNRIRAMSLIHEKLYQSDNLADINFDEYLHSLVKSLFISFGVDTNRVKYQIKVTSTNFGVEVAIPCGVIISELVSNSLKHAFPNGESGNISVEVTRNSLIDWSIKVSDNGVGFIQDAESDSFPSLGLQLVNNLASQLNGKVKIINNGLTEILIIFNGDDPHNEEN